MNTTKILGEAIGIQSQGTIDKTEEQIVPSLVSALIVGQFKRGRIDKPMVIHQGNIRGQLGHDPQNHFYNAVQDCLDTGVPSVQVLRVGKNNIDGGAVISCVGATNEFSILWGTTDDNSIPKTGEKTLWNGSTDQNPFGFEFLGTDTLDIPDGYEYRDNYRFVYPSPLRYELQLLPPNQTQTRMKFEGNNPTIIEMGHNHFGVCLKAEEPLNPISCDGATSSIKWAYAVKEGTSHAIALMTYVDGVQRDIIGNAPSWLTKDILNEMPAGEVAEGFYTANGVYKFKNTDSVPHRLEFVILNPDLFRSVVSDNPSLIQITDKLGEHVGVCLSPSTIPIGCAGALQTAETGGIWFSPTMRVNDIPYDGIVSIADVLEFDNNGSELHWSFRNISDHYLSIEIKTDPSGISSDNMGWSENTNPTLDVNFETGQINFCLAPFETNPISCEGATENIHLAIQLDRAGNGGKFKLINPENSDVIIEVDGDVLIDGQDFAEVLNNLIAQPYSSMLEIASFAPTEYDANAFTVRGYIAFINKYSSDIRLEFDVRKIGPTASYKTTFGVAVLMPNTPCLVWNENNSDEAIYNISACLGIAQT